SYPAADVADLARFARGLGLDPVPQQNLYGHQTETNLTRVYPELQEVPGDLTVYCPSHPQTHQIVGEIVTELLDLFEPLFFHMGHDEVQFKGMGQRIGVCPRCSSRPPARVFAEDVARISGVATRRNVRSMLWGDLLIPLEFDSGNVNGGDGRVYQAIDLIPRDLVIVDWHYHPGEDYRSTTFFRQQGFSVLSAVSFLARGIRAFAAHARQAGVDGVMYTTWCRPDPTSLPLESLLYAAQCFQHVESVDDPEFGERLQQRAQRLWEQWQTWAAR
ncbi:family 20 glycosylhydrolase, partial [bacterium]|nr:family 20 glycosylhydrolase [bacterium]